ncbi:MAG: phosphatase PAP2 family protein [Erysipelotrichaceae bacterium]
MIELILEFELKVSAFLQNLFSDTFLQPIMLLINNVFSFFGESLLAVLIICFVYFCLDKQKGKILGFALISTCIVNSMVKNVFKRKRPYMQSDEIELLRNVEGYSFPSGHSSNSGCLYPLVGRLFNNKITKRLAVLLPLMVAFSRIYLGAHFLSDVLSGLLLGFMMMIFSLYVFSHRNKSTTVFICLAVYSLGLLYCDTADYYSGYGLFVGYLLSSYFEEKYVNFSISSDFKVNLKRFIMALLVFAISNFSISYLIHLAGWKHLIFKTLRYCLTVFIVMGLLPITFKKKL